MASASRRTTVNGNHGLKQGSMSIRHAHQRGGTLCIDGIELPYVPCDTLNIVIVNPLGWARTGLTRVAETRLPRDFELVDADTGEAVAFERRAGHLEILTPRVPAYGYLTLEVRPVRRGHTAPCEYGWQEQTLSLHRNDCTLQFHPAGGLARWHDRMRSCQWCSDTVEFPMGSMLCDLGPASGRLRGKFARTREDTRIETSFSPVAARIIVESTCPSRGGNDGPRYRTEYALYAGRRELHIRTELLGDAAAVRAAYAFFPLAGEDPRVFLNRVGKSVEVENSSSSELTMPVRGVRLQMTHAGMNLHTLHTPLISLGRAGEYRFPPKGCHDAVVYATLLDNAHENGNRPAVRARWEFVLQPTGNDERDGLLARGVAELHRPLEAGVVRGRLEKPCGTLVNVEAEDIQLVSRESAGGKAETLRVYSPAAGKLAVLTGPGQKRRR